MDISSATWLAVTILLAMTSALAMDIGKPFGSGLSAATLPNVEMEIFNHTIDTKGSYGVMTHFWVTGPAGSLSVDDAVFRYYIDGEQTASIEFTPSLACGVAFDNDAAPWGTAWFGKGSKSGGWFHNFRIPFQNNVRVTAYHPKGTMKAFFVVVRGVENMPVVIGGIQLPPTARMRQFKAVNQTVDPLQYVPLVDLHDGNGLHFMSLLAVQSDSYNFIEGCFHVYTPYNTTFPGLLLSTGTEDYYNSAWGFSAGTFQMPTAGLTYISKTNPYKISAYRFHDMDPLPFQDGFRLVWRNGDAIDPKTGHKCFIETGGNTVGHPTKSLVTFYAWVYVF